MKLDDSKSWRRGQQSPTGAEAVPEVDLASTIRSLRGGLGRQWPLIAGVTVLLTSLALIYILLATPQYTARAALVIDPRISNSLSGPEAPTLLLSDALVVDSELKVLTSREVTALAARELGLFAEPGETDPEAPGAGVIAALRQPLIEADESGLLRGEEAEASRRDAVRRKLMEGFDIRRDGGTYVIDIAHSSPDPVFSMTAVNTLIDAYFQVSADASLSDTRRIASWLDQRVEVLAGDVQAADRSVADYRDQNQLYTMRDGLLPSQAELSDATDRLIRLRSELIEIQTKQDKIRDIVAQKDAGALLDGTLGGDVASPALRDFQTRYAVLVSEERDLATRFGRDNDVVTRNRQDQRQLRDLMFDEVAQIGGRLESQKGTLLRQIAATEGQVGELRSRAGSDAQKSIRLRELERDADAKRSQYGSMLQEMISAVQRETFKRAPARVIARAVPPDQESSPNARRLLVLSLFGGLVLGSGLGFLREMTDDKLRRLDDLREGLGLRALGSVPGVPVSGSPRRSRQAVGAMQTPPAMQDEAARGSLRAIIAQMQQLQPDSGALVTGIASVTRGAGRAGLAGWLADSLAQGGGRVMLMDLDPGGAGLTAHWPERLEMSQLNPVPDMDRELGQLLAETVACRKPLVVGLPEGADLLAPAQQRDMSTCISALRPHLDHILLILPPLSDQAEIEITALLADCALLVLRWGKTSLPAAAEALTGSSNLPPRLFGAVFTSDSLRAVSRYAR